MFSACDRVIGTWGDHYPALTGRPGHATPGMGQPVHERDERL